MAPRESDTKKRKPGRPPGVSSASRIGAGGKNAHPVTVQLPIAYLEILEREGKRFGNLRRGQFLLLLAQRKRKEISIERPTGAPSYEFSDDDLQTFKGWTWYVPQEDY